MKKYNKIELFFIKECMTLLAQEDQLLALKTFDTINKDEYIEFYDALTGYHLAVFTELVGKKAGYLRAVNTSNFKNITKKLFILYMYVFEKYHNIKLQYNIEFNNLNHFLELVEAI